MTRYRRAAFGVAAVSLGFLAQASAGDFNALCLRVSADWGTKGDVAAQCACLSALAAADPALASELTSLAETSGSDAEAYNRGSPAAKEAFDKCSVDA